MGKLNMSICPLENLLFKEYLVREFFDVNLKSRGDIFSEFYEYTKIKNKNKNNNNKKKAQV